MKPWIRVTVVAVLLVGLSFPVDVIAAFLWWVLTENMTARRR